MTWKSMKLAFIILSSAIMVSTKPLASKFASVKMRQNLGLANIVKEGDVYYWMCRKDCANQRILRTIILESRNSSHTTLQNKIKNRKYETKNTRSKVSRNDVLKTTEKPFDGFSGKTLPFYFTTEKPNTQSLDWKKIITTSDSTEKTERETLLRTTQKPTLMSIDWKNVMTKLKSHNISLDRKTILQIENILKSENKTNMVKSTNHPISTILSIKESTSSSIGPTFSPVYPPNGKTSGVKPTSKSTTVTTIIPTNVPITTTEIKTLTAQATTSIYLKNVAKKYTTISTHKSEKMKFQENPSKLFTSTITTRRSSKTITKITRTAIPTLESRILTSMASHTKDFISSSETKILPTSEATKTDIPKIENKNTYTSNSAESTTKNLLKTKTKKVINKFSISTELEREDLSSSSIILKLNVFAALCSILVFIIIF